MQDLIEIYDEKGNITKMEVVTIFRLDEYSFNYIIYKSPEDDNYFVAKYNGNNLVNLNTNLSKKELIFSNKVLKEVLTICN